MMNRILLVALIAGSLSGLAVTGLQMAWAIPLIQTAETYEEAAAATSHGESLEGAVNDETREPWAGLERLLLTTATNMLLGFGAGLLIAAVFVFHKAPSLKTGLAWGGAAFIALGLSPALGLPPELPGTAAAGLAARQQWWIGAAVATVAGLALLAYGRSGWFKIAAIGFLVLPHAIGAPHPPSQEALVPAGLQREFVVAALVTSAAFWLMLGGLTGGLAQRLGLNESNRAT